MNRIYKIVLEIILIFLCFAGFSQGLSKNTKKMKNNVNGFHGKSMIENSDRFIPIFIKNYESNEKIFVEIFFSMPVKIQSFSKECIYINDQPIPVNNIRFTKKKQGVLIIVPDTIQGLDEKDFTITIKDIVSISNKTIETMEITQCQTNSEYRYLEKENIWKRF